MVRHRSLVAADVGQSLSELGLLAAAKGRAGVGPEGIQTNDVLPGRLQGGDVDAGEILPGEEAVDGQVGPEDVRLQAAQLLHLSL